MKSLMILFATLLLSCAVFAKTVDLLSRAVEVKAKNGAHAKYIPLPSESRPAHRRVTHVRGPRTLDSGGDNCFDATVIPSLPFCDQGTTVGYTDDFTDCSGWGISPDVCYVYTPIADETATISLCGSGFDTELALFMLNPDCDNLAYMDCNDDACGIEGLQSCMMNDELSAGQTYMIIVDGYGGDAGDYTLRVTTDGVCGSDSCAPDSNGTGENCNSPIVISSLPAVLSGNTSTFADDYAGCNNEGAGSPDVVFSYTPTQDELVDIQTCNQTYFRSSVYIFRDGDMDTPYACPGAHCGSFWNNTFYDNAQLFCVSFEVGHTYCIVLDGIQPSDTGDFVMTIDPTSVQTCDPNQYCGFPRETEPNNSA
jgi:hypothetical protein